VRAPPSRQARSLISTWSSSLTLPLAISAAITYEVITLVMLAGSTRASMFSPARTWPVA
jgi:hypothetical protein